MKTVCALSGVDSFASWICAAAARTIRPGDVGAVRAQPESGSVTQPSSNVGGGQAMSDAHCVSGVPARARRDIHPPSPGVGAAQARYSEPNGIAPLHVRLLGGFCIERSDVGQTVSDWPRRSAKTLIKLLAVQPGHALHREQVIDVLWPKVNAESALNSLGKALHVARRALQPGLPRRQDSAYLRLADGMLVLGHRACRSRYGRVRAACRGRATPPGNRSV